MNKYIGAHCSNANDLVHELQQYFVISVSFPTYSLIKGPSYYTHSIFIYQNANRLSIVFSVYAVIFTRVTPPFSFYVFIDPAISILVGSKPFKIAPHCISKTTN
jgi:hypothetical protein